jgi:hypothetical protein
MLNEAGGVGLPTALLSKPVFKGREGTDPIGELNPGSPIHCRKVYPGDSPPAHNDEASQHNEENERQMHNNGGVGEETNEHHLVRLA